MTHSNPRPGMKETIDDNNYCVELDAGDAFSQYVEYMKEKPKKMKA